MPCGAAVEDRLRRSVRDQGNGRRARGRTRHGRRGDAEVVRRAGRNQLADRRAEEILRVRVAARRGVIEQDDRVRRILRERDGAGRAIEPDRSGGRRRRDRAAQVLAVVLEVRDLDSVEAVAVAAVGFVGDAERTRARRFERNRRRARGRRRRTDRRRWRRRSGMAAAGRKRERRGHESDSEQSRSRQAESWQRGGLLLKSGRHGPPTAPGPGLPGPILVA